MARYHAQKPTPVSGTIITDTLEEGARRMLERALVEEVDAYLGRDRYGPRRPADRLPGTSGSGIGSGWPSLGLGAKGSKICG